MLRAYHQAGYELDFFCGLMLDSFNEGLELSPSTMARVAALGATLGLDIYSAGDDEQAAVTPAS